MKTIKFDLKLKRRIEENGGYLQWLLENGDALIRRRQRTTNPCYYFTSVEAENFVNKIVPRVAK